MNTLAEAYPGDGVLIGCLEILALVTILITVTWVVEKLTARRHAALRCSLWQTALTGVLLAPALVLIGQQLPWRMTMFGTGAPTTIEGPKVPAQAVAAAPMPLPDSAPGAEIPGEVRSHHLGENPEPNLARQAGIPIVAQAEKHQVQPDADPARGKTKATKVDEISPPSANLFHALVTACLSLWAIGSIYRGACLMHACCRMHRLWGSLRALDAERWSAETASVARMLGVTRLPEIFVSPSLHSPLVAGLWPPRVILPERVLELSTPEQIREILIHECAHVMRWDPWMNLLQRLSVILYWVHPLVHVLNRRLDRAREEVCDNHVLAHADAPSYAETLLTVAQLCFPLPRLKGYLTMMPRHQNLESRVAELLEEGRDTATMLGWRQQLAILTGLVVLLGAGSSVGLSGATGARGGTEAAAINLQASAKDNKQLADAGKQAEGTAKLVGQVLNPDGSPASGAVVWAAKLTDGPLVRRETNADAKGRYVLQVPPGEWQIWSRLGTKGGEGKEGPSNNPEVVAGEVYEAPAIRLEERGTFRGRLLEAKTGKPIVGGKLFLDAGVVLATDVNGKFEIGGLTRTNHEAFVVAAGRGRIRILFETTARADTELEISVAPAAKIVGRVTDLDGKPIAGAYVGRYTSGSCFSINGLFEPCDGEGRFEYEGVHQEQPTELSAGAPGYFQEARTTAGLELGGKPHEFHFQLRPNPADNPNAKASDSKKWRLVSGVVHSPDDMPLARVLVRWGAGGLTSTINTRTDQEGRFRMTVPNEDNVVAVLPRDLAPYFAKVDEGGDRKLEIKVLKGQTVRGKVQDDKGKPIMGVQVTASMPAPGARFVNDDVVMWESAGYTDAAGNFEVKGVPNSEFVEFYLSKADLTEVRRYTPKSDDMGSPIPLTMQYMGAIQGKAVDRSGKPMRNFRVLVDLPREPKQGEKTAGFAAVFSWAGLSFTSPDGSFVVTGLGAGSVYRITVVADGHGEAVDDHVTAVPINRLAESKPLVFKAGAPVHLRVQALTADSKPLAGARVMLINGWPQLDRSFVWGYDDNGNSSTVYGRTEADGWADFPTLSFGGATVVLRAPGYARQRLVWRKSEEVLRTKLAPEAILNGEIRDAAGSMVEDCYVRLKYASEKGAPGIAINDQASTTVGPEAKGLFRIAELPAGVWTVTFTKNGLDTLHEEQVTLKAGETKELKIQLKAP